MSESGAIYDPSANKKQEVSPSQDEQIQLLKTQVQELVRVSGVQSQYLTALRAEIEELKKRSTFIS